MLYFPSAGGLSFRRFAFTAVVTMTMTSTHLWSRRSLTLFLALVICVASVYMVTFSGRIESGDALYLYDAVGSFVEFGDFRLDISAGTRAPQTFERTESYPLPTADNEPMQMLAAAPLYALARLIPGLGLAHTTYLLNVLVCALTVGVLFLYALALGYSTRTALVAGVLLGVATIVWPYSKSFFREPLAMLFLLLSGLLAERWRVGSFRSLPLLLALVGAVVALLLTKATSALALPGLFLIALPTLRGANRRVLGGVALALLVGAGLFVLLGLFGDELGIGRRYNPFARFIDDWRDYLPVALHSYLFSIGGSIWATSPVALLALPGMWLLYRSGRVRYVLAISALVLGFAVGYAALSGPQWFGGLSWPPRFLVPVVPYLLLAALPVIERVLVGRVSRLLLAAFVLLVVWSVWVQLTAVSLPWDVYTAGLPSRARGLLEWGGGLNLVEFMRPLVIPRLWAAVPLDVIWDRTGLLAWPLSFGVLALLSGVALFWLLRRSGERMWAVTVLLPVVFAGLTGVMLNLVYRDPLYLPDRPGLLPTMDILRAETGPGDIVMLSNREYENVFLNLGNLDGARVVGLAKQPGDRPSETQAPIIESDNPDVLLDNLTLPFIQSLAATRERLWLLENKGPAFDWAVRPVEQYMATHYYPLRLLMTEPADPTVRLLEYATVNAPDPYGFANPETLTDFTFGETFRLVGYTLPLGTHYAAGDVLPLSLMWRADAALESDYSVAWFLRTADGAPVAQGMDSRPRGDFEQTSRWTPGVQTWDNRGLVLPDGLASGEYQLWVKVYERDANFSPVDLAVSGGEVLDGVIAILPTRIQVD